MINYRKKVILNQALSFNELGWLPYYAFQSPGQPTRCTGVVWDRSAQCGTTLPLTPRGACQAAGALHTLLQQVGLLWA